MSIAWICSRKNWDLFFKKNGAEGCFGVAAQGKGCFLCPTNGRLSFLSRLCKKEGSLNNTRLLPHAKMLLVPMNFFPWWVDYTLEKNVSTEQIWFLPIVSYWEVVTRILIFCGYCVWSAYDLPSDARAFSLTSFEMLSSSMRLNKGFRLFNFSKVPPGSE